MTYEEWHQAVAKVNVHDDRFGFMIMQYPEYAYRLHLEVMRMVRDFHPELLPLMHPEASQ
jgi:hypothetical protein